MPKTTRLVDLFVVGQPKSGTTALASYLAQHPDICMSVPKEPNYFATDIVTESDDFHGWRAHYPVRDVEEYMSLFRHGPDASVWGEASADYLYSSAAAEAIRTHNPYAVIVASLRDPIAMMWSLHQEYVNEATEDEDDFLSALEKEDERRDGRNVPKGARCPSLLLYTERTKYAEQLSRYLDRFPREQMLVVTAEQLREDSAAVCRDIAERVGTDASFNPTVEAVHERKQPRFGALNRVARDPRLTRLVHKMLGPQLYTRLQKGFAEPLLLTADSGRSPVPDDVRDQLQSRVRPEVEKVSDLLDRDLVTAWGY